MMSLPTVFWLLLIIFGTIGGMRGWAKEILVLFSLVLALFIDTLIKQYVLNVPNIENALQTQGAMMMFYVRATFFILLAFFGYETPAVVSGLAGKGKRERLQDILLGVVIGMLNGYLLIGTIWFYLHQANYQLPGIIPPPPNDSNILNYIKYMPPGVIGPPYIYFAVAVAFVFVIVVFL
ncbi:MAG: CvpA family protein [Chloroflexota bacterium]